MDQSKTYTGVKDALIYILSDQNGRYNNETVVTAAHEMLHLAYRRLNRTDRQNVNSMVESAATAITDGSLDRVIQSATDATDKDDELHSVLGSTRSSLGGNIETYFDRYFTDRSKVVAANRRSL